MVKKKKVVVVILIMVILVSCSDKNIKSGTEGNSVPESTITNENKTEDKKSNINENKVEEGNYYEYTDGDMDQIRRTVINRVKNELNGNEFINLDQEIKDEINRLNDIGRDKNYWNGNYELRREDFKTKEGKDKIAYYDNNNLIVYTWEQREDGKEINEFYDTKGKIINIYIYEKYETTEEIRVKLFDDQNNVIEDMTNNDYLNTISSEIEKRFEFYSTTNEELYNIENIPLDKLIVKKGENYGINYNDIVFIDGKYDIRIGETNKAIYEKKESKIDLLSEYYLDDIAVLTLRYGNKAHVIKCITENGKIKSIYENWNDRNYNIEKTLYEKELSDNVINIYSNTSEEIFNKSKENLKEFFTEKFTNDFCGEYVKEPQDLKFGVNGINVKHSENRIGLVYMEIYANYKDKQFRYSIMFVSTKDKIDNFILLNSEIM